MTTHLTTQTPLPPLIPRSLLFGSPDRLAPALAPDGERIAYLAPRDGVANIWVQDLDGAHSRPVTADAERGVLGFTWAPDGKRLLVPADHDGDERGHLFVVDLDGGPPRDITPFRGVQARLIGFDQHRPGTALVGLNVTDPARHDAYRIDLGTGQLELDARNQGFTSWVASSGPSVLGAFAHRPDGAVSVLVRVGEDDWRECHTVPAEDAGTFRVLDFDQDRGTLWLLSAHNANTTRLVELDVATGAERVRYEDPQHDVEQVLISPRTRRPDLVVVRRERELAHGLTNEVARDLAVLRGHFTGDVRVLSRDRVDRRWLVQDNRDNHPATYHVFNRDTGAVRLLFGGQPALAEHTLATVEPFTFRARDGLTVAGYLTFPPGRPRRGLPAVLAVHGGPWSRDVWGLRAESQWLANRGYLVVQVNYRGSVGYGKAFVNAGDREWGGRMQDDLTDAVRWVVGEGFAEAHRIGVFGASYGGYAALVGATFTPELFRCAVAVAAPSNLASFISSTPGYGQPAATRLTNRIGHPETDSEFLWSRSPISKVDSIRIPIMLVHGARDPRVSRAESERFVEALKYYGIPHEYLVFPDEGHAIVRPRNRLAYYAAVERFLAAQLGGRHEPDE